MLRSHNKQSTKTNAKTRRTTTTTPATKIQTKQPHHQQQQQRHHHKILTPSSTTTPTRPATTTTTPSPIQSHRRRRHIIPTPPSSLSSSQEPKLPELSELLDFQHDYNHNDHGFDRQLKSDIVLNLRQLQRQQRQQQQVSFHDLHSYQHHHHYHDVISTELINQNLSQRIIPTPLPQRIIPTPPSLSSSSSLQEPKLPKLFELLDLQHNYNHGFDHQLKSDFVLNHQQQQQVSFDDGHSYNNHHHYNDVISTKVINQHLSQRNQLNKSPLQSSSFTSTPACLFPPKNKSPGDKSNTNPEIAAIIKAITKLENKLKEMEYGDAEYTATLSKIDVLNAELVIAHAKEAVKQAVDERERAIAKAKLAVAKAEQAVDEAVDGPPRIIAGKKLKVAKAKLVVAKAEQDVEKAVDKSAQTKLNDANTDFDKAEKELETALAGLGGVKFDQRYVYLMIHSIFFCSFLLFRYSMVISYHFYTCFFCFFFHFQITIIIPIAIIAVIVTSYNLIIPLFSFLFFYHIHFPTTAAFIHQSFAQLTSYNHIKSHLYIIPTNVAKQPLTISRRFPPKSKQLISVQMILTSTLLSHHY